MDAICKLAAINALLLIGSYLYGVGISSLSVSLDGVSQTFPFTRGGKYGMFTDRISAYKEEIDQMWQDLKYEYAGLIFDVL